MYTRDHQIHYRSLVPPLSTPMRQIVSAGRDGWTLQTASWVNSAVGLLASVAAKEPAVLALLERQAPILDLGRCPERPSDDAHFAFLGGSIYAASSHVGYLLYCANALGHEGAHVVRRHEQLPGDGSLERLLTRAQWEDEAHTDELRLHDKFDVYFRRLRSELTVDASPWHREIQHYRTNALRRRAYFRGRAAIVRVAQLLAEVAHLDTSVEHPPQSQLFALGGQLVRELLEIHPTAQVMVEAHAATERTLEGYHIPPSLPQHAQLTEQLKVWRSESSRFLQLENQRTAAFTFLH
ncbi:MAG: hypothetical protein U0136_00835 [Bdellovibrionota bacterium]